MRRNKNKRENREQNDKTFAATNFPTKFRLAFVRTY